jgi:aminodeoxyfutalosine deaminase
VYFSRWLVTSDDVIENAALALAGSKITFVGTQSAFLLAEKESNHQPVDTIDLGNSVLIPGLINCHVHTNFPSPTTFPAKEQLFFESGSMVEWVKAALAAREARSVTQCLADIQAALNRMQETGIVAIGEIANDFQSLQPIIDSGMICRFFAERLGFPRSIADAVIEELWRDLEEPERMVSSSIWVSLHPAPHAPYSCSAELIQRLTGASELSSIHIAESKEEVRLLSDGSGSWRERLQEIGKNDPDWTPPAVSPVRYLQSLGVLSPRLLLVHAVQVDDSDIETIAQSGATVVLCPGSNAFIDVGSAPLPKFIERNIPLALGTDSLASNSDLDLFAEMRQLREMFPATSPRKLFSLATIGGAAALGLTGGLGELKVGYSPGVFAVDLSSERESLDINSSEELFDSLITVGAGAIRKLAAAEMELTGIERL